MLRAVGQGNERAIEIRREHGRGDSGFWVEMIHQIILCVDAAQQRANVLEL
tara:strand:- start:679 stop:831 length:153 start_codon:yes stop_codon:yes gene_type:complete